MKKALGSFLLLVCFLFIIGALLLSQFIGNIKDKGFLITFLIVYISLAIISFFSGIYLIKSK